ncbi:NADH-quinone oxidoreductase subunit NuoE [Candidatus Sumerlaeota bacterium]|nr:NADH-quinone oxidoreductase subunit NuoE [Candidatus Sumerlaeota bacterium]
MSEQLVVDEEKIQEILHRWETSPRFLVEILQDIQEEYHYLPREILIEVSRQLNVPLSRIYHIATFFKAFTLEPRGKHLINVCMGTACQVKGAPRIIDAVERELAIKPGETTKDRKFTLETVRCLGCCGLAPVVTVDGEVYGQVTPAKVSKILKKYD